MNIIVFLVSNVKKSLDRKCNLSQRKIKCTYNENLLKQFFNKDKKIKQIN